MNTSKIIIFALFLAVIFSAQSTVLAQEEESEETPYWYVLSYKIPWAKMDSLENLVKKYTIPIVAEAKERGTIVDYKLLVHHTGDEYNLVIMTKYPSWVAMDEGEGFDVVFESIEPDKLKRDQVYAAFEWIFEGAVHKDNIYLELTE